MPANLRRIHEYWSVRDLVRRAVDGGCILGGLAMGLGWSAEPSTDRWLLAGAAGVIAFFLAAEISGLYRNWRGASTEREVGCALATWGLTLLVLLALGFLARWADFFSGRSLAAWFLLTPALAASARVLIRRIQSRLRSRGFNTRRYAIVGVNELAFQLARNIERSVELGLRLVGFYDDRPPDRLPEVPADLGQQVGDVGELIQHARQRRVDIIYITFPMRAEQRIRRILDRLGDTTASVYIVPDFFVFELLHSRWTSIRGLPVVSIFESPFYGIDGLLKRAMDLTLGTLVLLVAAVPMLLIAAALKLTSSGPVFFRQKRYGLDGREILVWKFRTMRVCENGPVVRQARKEDPRVTRVGRFLRRTSLDELPQLFNVLRGNMSLVGPRPHASTHNEEYRKLISGYMLRHKVKPGITGLAQVNGCRGETDTLEKMEKRIACDHQYIRQWSLWMDCKILLKTVFVVFSGKNAY